MRAVGLFEGHNFKNLSKGSFQVILDNGNAISLPKVGTSSWSFEIHPNIPRVTSPDERPKLDSGDVSDGESNGWQKGWQRGKGEEKSVCLDRGWCQRRWP